LNIWFSYQIGIQKIVQTVLVFFQIGGGIAGDFQYGAYVVPRYGNARCTFWSYFCQIYSTSYGSYSGANQMKKLLGVNYKKHQNLLLNPMLLL
jgi:hypothetical protein